MSRETVPDAPAGAIAIVGMACRYAGADSVERFWQNIVGKVESIRFFSEDELSAAGVRREVLQRPNYVRAAGVLEDIAGFDAALFGISAREAQVLDPQHRVFLECCWEALEDASIDPARSAARIGVYAGCNLSDYALRQRDALVDGDTASYMEALVANDKDYLSTRVSYRLNLRGPSLTLGSACSTSLSAVALACQTLQAHAADAMLAGGVCIAVPAVRGYQYGDGSDALSVDGHCRAFDASATGTAPGAGAGVVVLKRLEDALADGDAIHAVIRGYALNNDGNDKVGYWAPSVQGHAETVAEALEFAGVNARDIGYLEAHGTGTPMGDPIEIAALTSAFRRDTAEQGYCAIGSVKTNIGHTSQAAGAAGLIKAALALEHRVLPPSLNFERANPRLELETSPFFVNTESRPWASSSRRRAGVSSLGLGGTNVHVVLEEAPSTPVGPSGRPELLVLSANGEAALDAGAARLADHLERSPELPLAGVASALQRGRRELPVRAYLVASTGAEAVRALRARDQGRFARRAAASAREVVFVFPGASAVDVSALRQLAAAFPVLLATLQAGVRTCADLGVDLGFLLPDSSAPAVDTRADDAPSSLLALLLAEVALARLLQHCGIRPAAVIGHSAGEYAAACVSGVLALEDALALQFGRSQLLSRLPRRGAMLSVNLPADEVRSKLGADVSIAAYNADDVTLLSGHADELAAWADRLAGEDVVCRPSAVLGAAHSRFVDPILDGLKRAAAGVAHRAPQVRWISTVSGEPLPARPLEPEYWSEQTRKPVRFVQAIALAAADPERVFLEVGPGGNLGSLVQRILRTRGLPNLALGMFAAHSSAALDYLLGQAGRLWALGVPVDLVALGRTAGLQPARLPSYAFERVRYWMAEASPGRAPAAISGETRLHLYRPSWLRTPPPSAASAASSTAWLVLRDGCALCGALCELARRSGRVVIEAQCGRDRADAAGQALTVDPTCSESLLPWLQRLASQGPTGATLLRCHAGRGGGDALSPALEPAALARALAASGLSVPLEWVMLTSHVQRVLGVECGDAALGCAAAAVRVLPRELPNLRARWIDVDPAADQSPDCTQLARLVAAELDTDAGFHAIAYRHGQRWQREYRSLEAPAATEQPSLRAGGRYLITGGLGRMGLSLAQYLSELPATRVALTHTRTLPPEARWPELASDTAEVGTTPQILSSLLQLRARGAQLALAQVDAADSGGMEALWLQLERDWGAIDGVFHFAATLEDKAFGLLGESNPAAADANGAPKVRGAQVLAALSERHGASFCCLASSISAELGGLGNFAYSAANRALDQLAERMDGRGGVRWVSIDFDYYRSQSAEDGRLDPREQRSGALQKRLLEGALRGRDLYSVIERALSARGTPQVVACGQPIEAHLAQLNADQAPKTLATRPDLTRAYRAAGNPVQRELVEIWEELLSVSPIGVDDDFFELGGDSLMVLRLTSMCRERLGFELAVKTLLGSPTIDRLCHAIAAGERAPELLVLKAPDEPRHTLVCVPYAGGSALGFQAFAERLASDCALLVLPALREVREPEALFAAVLQQLEQIDTPVSVYGHCGGSFAAVELARRLERAGRAPHRVFAAATLPPLPGVTLSDEALLGLNDGANLMAFMQSLGGLPENASEADAREAVAAMHDDGVRLSAVFEQFRADAQAAPLGTPLVCLFGDADPMTLGWRERVQDWGRFFRSVTSHVLAGANHYFVHTEPERVAALVHAELGSSTSMDVRSRSRR